jgi:T-complex protein 1 subunit theta
MKNGTLNVLEAGLLEPYDTKRWAIKYACDAALTVLSVDSVIMAKPAGGPKPRQQKAADWDDED